MAETFAYWNHSQCVGVQPMQQLEQYNKNQTRISKMSMLSILNIELVQCSLNLQLLQDGGGQLHNTLAAISLWHMPF